MDTRTNRSHRLGRIREVLHAPALGPSELILSLTALFYGAGLLLPLEEFAAYRTQGQMITGWDERLWGITFLSTGMVRIASVIGNWYGGRIWTTVLSIGLWGYLTMSFLWAVPLSSRVMVLSAWTLCEAWTLFRIQQR